MWDIRIITLSTYEYGVGREKLATFTFFFLFLGEDLGGENGIERLENDQNLSFSFFFWLKMGVVDAFYSKKLKLKNGSTLRCAYTSREHPKRHPFRFWFSGAPTSRAWLKAFPSSKLSDFGGTGNISLPIF